MSEQWFGGDDPRDEAESHFPDRLRERAASWDIPALNPDHTRTLTPLVPLIISIEVPALSTVNRQTCALRNLHVGYWQHGPYGRGLEGEWGCWHPLDSHRYDVDGLTVVGVEGEPVEFADWTAAWLHRQLKRPLVRDEWLRSDVVASRIRLADTGLVLHTEGRRLSRWLNRQPHRTLPLQPSS